MAQYLPFVCGDSSPAALQLFHNTSFRHCYLYNNQMLFYTNFINVNKCLLSSLTPAQFTSTLACQIPFFLLQMVQPPPSSIEYVDDTVFYSADGIMVLPNRRISESLPPSGENSQNGQTVPPRSLVPANSLPFGLNISTLAFYNLVHDIIQN